MSKLLILEVNSFKTTKTLMRQVITVVHSEYKISNFPLSAQIEHVVWLT